jgi:hypothetical protein
MDYMDLIVRLVIVAASFLAAWYVVPWLKAKGIYAEVQRMVSAAEKWAQSHDIDKNAWVVAGLEEIGIKVTPRVKRWIESAVMELDIAIGMSSTPDLDALFSDSSPKE